MPKGRMNNGRIRKFNGNGYRKKTFSRSYPAYDKPEMKFRDTEVNLASVTLAWSTKNPTTVLCLNAIAQGDSPIDRDGRVYYIHSVMLKGQLTSVADQADNSPKNDLIFRVCMVLDKQTNQTELTASDVMRVVGTEDFLSFRNLDFTTRFKIIHDKNITMRRFYQNEGVSSSYASGAESVRWDWYHKFANPIKVVCSGTGGTIAEITNNSIQIIVCANTAAQLKLSYQARVRFSG